MTLTCLWATKIGDPDWAEQLITATADAKHLENAKAWAEANGFSRLRTSESRDGDKPDFTGTVNI